MNIYNESELFTIKNILNYITPTNYNIIFDILIVHLDIHSSDINISIGELLSQKGGFNEQN